MCCKNAKNLKNTTPKIRYSIIKAVFLNNLINSYIKGKSSWGFTDQDEIIIALETELRANGFTSSGKTTFQRDFHNLHIIKNKKTEEYVIPAKSLLEELYSKTVEIDSTVEYEDLQKGSLFIKTNKKKVNEIMEIVKAFFQNQYFSSNVLLIEKIDESVLRITYKKEEDYTAIEREAKQFVIRINCENIYEFSSILKSKEYKAAMNYDGLRIIREADETQEEFDKYTKMEYNSAMESVKKLNAAVDRESEDFVKSEDFSPSSKVDRKDRPHIRHRKDKMPRKINKHKKPSFIVYQDTSYPYTNIYKTPDVLIEDYIETIQSKE